MSNFHRDLQNDQLHHPKDFVAAANSTKLTKNATGNLEWIADSGGGGGVSQITAGTGVTISPSGGTGNVTINASIGGVSSIVAGTGITISPVGGTGAVTINSSGKEGEQISTSWRGCHIFEGKDRETIAKILNSPCVTDRSNPDLHGTSNGVYSQSIQISSMNAIGGSIHVVETPSATISNWIGRMVSNAASVGKISLFKCTLICVGEQPAEYSMTYLSEQSFNLAAGQVFCWEDTSMNGSLAQGDLIIPVIALNAGEASTQTYSTSLRLNQS